MYNFSRMVRAVDNRAHRIYMDTKQYRKEIEESNACMSALGVLNSYKTALLNESRDATLLEASKALEAAKVAYNKAANNVVLGDSTYNKLQTECVRTSVSEFCHRHNLPNLAKWFDANGKDTQTSIIDTAQKLASNLKSLHDSFSKGAKVARKKAKTIDELKAEAAAILAKVASMENGDK